MIHGLPQLEARFRSLGDTRGLSRTLGLETVAGAKRSVRHKTGNTRRTIRVASVSDDGVTVTVGGAGLWLETGTKPHIIRPKTAKVLRFPGKGVKTTLGGRVSSPALRKLGSAAFRFARIVHHPGTKAYPFLIPAAKAALNKFGASYIVERWNRAA